MKKILVGLVVIAMLVTIGCVNPDEVDIHEDGIAHAEGDEHELGDEHDDGTAHAEGDEHEQQTKLIVE